MDILVPRWNPQHGFKKALLAAVSEAQHLQFALRAAVKAKAGA